MWPDGSGWLKVGDRQSDDFAQPLRGPDPGWNLALLLPKAAPGSYPPELRGGQNSVPVSALIDPELVNSAGPVPEA